jgi:hypothetical protein
MLSYYNRFSLGSGDKDALQELANPVEQFAAVMHSEKSLQEAALAYQKVAWSCAVSEAIPAVAHISKAQSPNLLWIAC